MGPATTSSSNAGVSAPRLLDHPDLAKRIRAQDPDALTAVVDAYLDQIVRAARGAGLNQHQTEEAAQSTFTTFIETAQRFEGRSHHLTSV
jgi:DNA-directed RNA polymerase specialized sigma24 family protein